MSELAKQVHRTKSTVTALVEKLERNGYVLRIPDPEDSRGVLVRLTDKGRALEPAFEAISNGLQRLITERLWEGDLGMRRRSGSSGSASGQVCERLGATALFSD